MASFKWSSVVAYKSLTPRLFKAHTGYHMGILTETAETAASTARCSTIRKYITIKYNT